MIANLSDLQSRLREQMNHCSKVFIVGHNSPDFDAIGSAIGLSVLAKALGKEHYIIVDDDPSTIEPGAKKIIDESKDTMPFITHKDFLEKVDSDSMLIVTDTNRLGSISVADQLNSFKSIFIVDHHCEGKDTILTDNSFISVDSSSSCEIVTRLLNEMKIPYEPHVASYLLSGISLDTKRFKQSTTAITHDVAEKLLERGAQIDYVNNLFLQDFDSYCRISNLIVNGTTIHKYSKSLLTPIQVSFTIDRNHPTTVYQKEDYAKAADQMMKFNGMDASFALGFIGPDMVHVSARSGKRVNVGKIMNQMNGGGNLQSAGGQYRTNDPFQIEKKLIQLVPIGILIDDEVMDAPQLIKRQQIIEKV